MSMKSEKSGLQIHILSVKIAHLRWSQNKCVYISYRVNEKSTKI